MKVIGSMYLLDFIKTFVSEKRFSHILRVTVLTQKLAMFHGVNVKECVIAALFHDICKEYAIEETYNIMKKYFPLYIDLPKQSWHGFASSLILKENFPNLYNETISEAIKFHTLGKKNWNSVGYVLYISDFCDPAKYNEEGLENISKIWQVAHDNLLKAVLLRINCCNHSLKLRGLFPSQCTVNMLNEIESKLQCCI